MTRLARYRVVAETLDAHVSDDRRIAARERRVVAVQHVRAAAPATVSSTARARLKVQIPNKKHACLFAYVLSPNFQWGVRFSTKAR